MIRTQPGKPRTKSESIAALQSQFIEAQTPGAGNRIKSKRTESGLKDTYQNFFINRLLDASKRRQGTEPRSAINATLKDFPSETMSPVWRIRGLDPHADTPVEILHVVLLGFIKYLWRDVIENQIKKNPEKKAELAARLSSINVDGLGLDSRLPGKTLVAPFVLKDFVSADCFATWISLSKLVPLIWQPEIKDLDSYIRTLEHEIEQFLLHAAKWNIRWFNKPKFHILVHLPAHIRRFGPAILFATEVFESYNAIIRAKSIHSNRLAPSRDIAFAFAKQNRIRHMLSGGVFLDRSHVTPNKKADEDFDNVQLPQRERVTQVQQYFRSGSFNKEDWASVGQSVVDVVAWSNDSVGKYFRMSEVKKPLTGSMTLDATAAEQRWGNTQSGRCDPDSTLFSRSEKSEGKFCRGKDIILVNGDKCMTSGYAACSDSSGSPFTRDGILIVCVHEILQLKQLGSLHANSVLVEPMVVGTQPSTYGMPHLEHSGRYLVVEPTVLQCTVNVQHDCSRNHCQVERVRSVLQERERTGEVNGALVHRGNLKDVVLNTAQMRDAKFVQRFRIPGKALTLEQELTASAAREWDTLNKPRTSRTLPLGSLGRASTHGVPPSSSSNSSMPASPLSGSGLPPPSTFSRATPPTQLLYHQNSYPYNTHPSPSMDHYHNVQHGHHNTGDTSTHNHSMSETQQQDTRNPYTHTSNIRRS
ncbi:hypothetical protein FB446DRAFT_784792 [Lentinula raphanica]|nr:hypothetical protein FB446DRAFT_784792 [Lentinula raphanica]